MTNDQLILLQVKATKGQGCGCIYRCPHYLLGTYMFFSNSISFYHCPVSFLCKKRDGRRVSGGIHHTYIIHHVHLPVPFGYQGPRSRIRYIHVNCNAKLDFMSGINIPALFHVVNQSVNIKHSTYIYIFVHWPVLVIKRYKSKETWKNERIAYS